MMMTNGFGMGGSVFMALFILVFLAILGTFLAMLLRGISQWSRDNRSPRLTVEATVVAKRGDVSHHHHQDANGIGHASSTTTYYVTFQVASGDRMELCVGGSEYGMLVEGDYGNLTFQGTRYLGFERKQA